MVKEQGACIGATSEQLPADHGSLDELKPGADRVHSPVRAYVILRVARSTSSRQRVSAFGRQSLPFPPVTLPYDRACRQELRLDGHRELIVWVLHVDVAPSDALLTAKRFVPSFPQVFHLYFRGVHCVPVHGRQCRLMRHAISALVVISPT